MKLLTATRNTAKSIIASIIFLLLIQVQATANNDINFTYAPIGITLNGAEFGNNNLPFRLINTILAHNHSLTR